jgi:transposase
MLTLTISEADCQRLNYERFRHPSPIVQKRLHALYLKAATNLAHQTIAAIVDIHPDTLTHYIHRFRQGGYAALTSLAYGTNQSVLDQHSQSLTAAFKASPPQTAAQAGEQITTLTGLKRRPTQVRTWLHKHGFGFRKAGAIPGKADPQAQQQFLTQILQPAIQQAKNEQIHLLFMDAAHMVMGSFLCQLWCLARLLLPSPSGRKRLNVLGAVDAISKQVHRLTNHDYITAPTVVAFLAQLVDSYTDGRPLWVVLDNARYQRCELVMAAARRLGIELVYLPPYSPNLNLIERLWKWVKKRSLYGRYYADFGSFEQAILDTLDKGNTTYQSELDSLLSLNFQRF